MPQFKRNQSASPSVVWDVYGVATPLGNSSYVLLSIIRPDRFLLVLPHSLKKKRTPASLHWSRMLSTQFSAIFLVLGPDPPPVMTQSWCS